MKRLTKDETLAKSCYEYHSLIEEKWPKDKLKLSLRTIVRLGRKYGVSYFDLQYFLSNADTDAWSLLWARWKKARSSGKTNGMRDNEWMVKRFLRWW
jgi:hypothetical protein